MASSVSGFHTRSSLLQSSPLSGAGALRKPGGAEEKTFLGRPRRLVTALASASAFWRLVILLIGMLWATNFATIKEITSQPGVTTQLYIVSRFTVAALSLFPALFTVSSSSVFLRAAECGSWVALGYIGQAIGLVTTTAAKSCFICSLNVVFVSGAAAVTARKFDPQTAIAALLAVSGVGLLELEGSQSFVIGDLFSLAQPICFGIGYIRLEEIMRDSPDDARGVTAVKLLMVAVGSWAYFLATNGGAPDFGPVLASGPALSGVMWCGIVTTSLSLLVESVAFQYVDAATASVIFTTEPLWAALFAFWLIAEPFAFADGVGGLLVIAANLIKQLPPSMLPLGLGSTDGPRHRSSSSDQGTELPALVAGALPMQGSVQQGPQYAAGQTGAARCTPECV